MAHLTDNFAFEGPLSPRVREAIATALDQGWAEPKKLSQASHRALELRTNAIEEVAGHLQVSPAKVEVTGEPHLLHLLALKGYSSEASHLYTSSVDVGKIRAIARAHQGPSTMMSVDANGLIAQVDNCGHNDVISLQVENGETGICQELDQWRSLTARVVIDGTRTVPRAGIVEGFAAATFDAQSWNGPTGVGFLVVNEEESYRYPLAHIAPIRVPGSYSLPLLVGAAIALDEYQSEKSKIEDLRNLLSQNLRGIPGVTVIGAKQEPSRYLSIVVDELSGEEVLRNLMRVGITTDSGSACSPEDLTPSHVIAAMGFETTGHLRFTIHPGMTEGGITDLTQKLEEVLTQLRS